MIQCEKTYFRLESPDLFSLRENLTQWFSACHHLMLSNITDHLLATKNQKVALVHM